MDDFAFIRSSSGANLTLNDAFVVIGASESHMKLLDLLANTVNIEAAKKLARRFTEKYKGERRHSLPGIGMRGYASDRLPKVALARVNQFSGERCGEIAVGKPVRAARLCGSKVPFN